MTNAPADVKQTKEALQQYGHRGMGQHFVPFTDTTQYIRELEGDYKISAIVDKIVRVGTHSTGHATIEDVEGEWSAGGHRDNPWFTRVYVASSYIARGQQIRFERYCGVALKPNAAPVSYDFGQPLSEATAKRVIETHRQLENALADKTLDIRAGGMLMVAEGVWLPEPDEVIEAAPQERCATCDELIYYANSAWRARDTKRAEHLVEGRGLRGQAMKKIDHYHDPVIKDLQVPV